MTDERLLDVAQAAKRWNVCVATIKRWIYAKKLPAIQTPGKHWRIPESAIPHRRSSSKA